MPDYKSMYYHLAGRVAGAVESLEALSTALQTSVLALQATLEATSTTHQASITALIALKESLKNAQQTTEDMFISSENDDEEGSDGET